MSAPSVPSASFLSDHAAIAASAAQVSAPFLLSAFEKVIDYRISGEDAKLSEDRRSESLIIDHISALSDFPILSEEHGWHGKAAEPGEFYWVIDPLDGSYNFLFRIPLFAIAVALCVDDRPIMGCVNDIARNTLFLGGEGFPLEVNGVRRGATADVETGRILATGFPIARTTGRTGLDSPDLSFRKVRMLGSAALSLAWVADGRFDHYRECGIRWWDVAAGLALIGAVGGSIRIEPHITGAQFSPTGPLDVTASHAAAGVARTFASG